MRFTSPNHFFCFGRLQNYSPLHKNHVRFNAFLVHPRIIFDKDDMYHFLKPNTLPGYVFAQVSQRLHIHQVWKCEKITIFAAVNHISKLPHEATLNIVYLDNTARKHIHTCGQPQEHIQP